MVSNIKIVDSHCDTLLKINSGEIDFFKNSTAHVDLPKLVDSGVAILFMAVYIHSIYKPGLSLRRSLELINDFLNIAKDPQLIHIKNRKDLETVITKYPEKLGIIMSLEGAEPIESISILDIFAYLGVRCIGLTWNQRNMLADGCNETGGLTTFGKQIVKRMAELGILCDISHLCQTGFWDVISITENPVIASHSNCYAICPHPRNLTDNQIKELANIGGLISITFYPEFIGLERDIGSVAAHIRHVANLVGVDHVGIGSDFDGAAFYLDDLENSSKLPNLIKILHRNGFNDQEIVKIMGDNIIELLKRTLPRG